MTLKAFRVSDGSEVMPGDVLVSARGTKMVFHRAASAPDGYHTGKIQVEGASGPEHYMTIFGLEVREICAVCGSPLDHTDISGRADEFVHLDDDHEDHAPVRSER